MDLLDRVYPAGHDLLARVDAALLAGGAPADHPFWPLARRLGGLPGELVGYLAGVHAEPLAAAADPLRQLARGYDAGLASVPPVLTWRGPAAEGFTTQWSALGAHLAGEPPSMAGRLVEMAGYTDEVAGWLARGRRELAGALAECLGSAQAVTVQQIPAGGLEPGRLPSREALWAAADIGAHLLGAAAGLLDDGLRLTEGWAERLAELIYRPPMATGASAGGELRIG
jgi:hypothetical protein